jgi:hypothetical protein
MAGDFNKTSVKIEDPLPQLKLSFGLKLRDQIFEFFGATQAA